jgi:hypothetical protein
VPPRDPRADPGAHPPAAADADLEPAGAGEQAHSAHPSVQAADRHGQHAEQRRGQVVAVHGLQRAGVVRLSIAPRRMACSSGVGMASTWMSAWTLRSGYTYAR